jgi:hypothetical protein
MPTAFAQWPTDRVTLEFDASRIHALSTVDMLFVCRDMYSELCYVPTRYE